MPGIWRKAGDEWVPMIAGPVPDERELQARIVGAIVKDSQALPLSGQPHITVLGERVKLTNGEADVVAIEKDGRPVIIEAKLYRNPESRRRVVAQAFEYAAAIHGMNIQEFEGNLLGPSLKNRQYKSIADAVGEIEDTEQFYSTIREHLADGDFRIVFLLDKAHPVLINLVGYLEKLTGPRILLDIVTVTNYDLGGEEIFQTQRIDPERETRQAAPTAVKSGQKTKSIYVPGSRPFRELNTTVSADSEAQAQGTRIADWAEDLEANGLCRVSTSETSGGNAHLRLHLLGEDKTFVHFHPEPTGCGAWLYRLVIERAAPRSWPRIEELTRVAGKTGGAEPTPELLDALADAYREAAGVASSP